MKTVLNLSQLIYFLVIFRLFSSWIWSSQNLTYKQVDDVEPPEQSQTWSTQRKMNINLFD